jgi:hypothetical protein
MDLEPVIPDLAPIALPIPHQSADRLANVLAGRASTRAGIDWPDWSRLTQKILGIDQRQIGQVTRAWMETGLIDVAAFARWRHRSILARQPQLIAFRLGLHVGATLVGLTLPKTRDRLRDAAEQARAPVETRLSVSTFVPQSLSLRFESVSHIEELGVACGIGVSWIDLEALESTIEAASGFASQPPANYDWSYHWPRWSLLSTEYPAVEVEHRVRRDRPDVWVVSREHQRMWSYDANVARTWAAAFMDAPAVTVVGATLLAANHAYLPLPLARAIATLGSGLPGPSAVGDYQYPVGSLPLRERVLGILGRTFDPSRLISQAARQTIG